MAQFDSGLITGKANRRDQGDSSSRINSERCSWLEAGKQYMGYVYMCVCVCCYTFLSLFNNDTCSEWSALLLDTVLGHWWGTTNEFCHSRSV